MNCTEESGDAKQSFVIGNLHGVPTSLLLAGVTLVVLGWFEVALSNLIFADLRHISFWLFVESGSVMVVGGVLLYMLLWIANGALTITPWFDSTREHGGQLAHLRRLCVGRGEPFSFWYTLFAFALTIILVFGFREVAALIPSIARLTVTFVNTLTFAFSLAVVFFAMRLAAHFMRRRVPWHFVAACVGVAFTFVYFDVHRFTPLRSIWPASIVAMGAILLTNWYLRDRVSTRDKASLSVVVVLALVGFGISSARLDLRSSSWWRTYNSFGFGIWSLVDLSHDIDADGHGNIWGGADCAPLDPDVFPGAMETVADSIDNNCAGGDLREFEAPSFTGPLRYSQTGESANIILITVDTLRADAFETVLARHDLGMIEEFWQESIVFRRAYAPAPHTKEAMPSLMSGVYPISWQQLGVKYGIEPTMAEVARSLEYRTEAVVALPYVDVVTFRGFERVDNELGDQIARDSMLVVDPLVLNKAVDRLNHLGGGPFMFWVHFFDPHGTYVTTETDARTPELETERGRYLNEVRRTALSVSAFLEELRSRGLYEDSIIIFSSDHGEGLGEHRVATHSLWGFESALKVPLAIKPARGGGRIVEENATLVDVFPTVMDLANISGAHVDDGVSWARGKGAPGERPIYFESSYRVAEKALFRGVIRDQFKLTWDVRRNTYSLFDLSKDALELRNLVDSRPRFRDELIDLMNRHFDEHFNDRYLRAKAKVWDFRKPIEPDEYLGRQSD